jgi:thioredoxin-like negative regulator of GroEL
MAPRLLSSPRQRRCGLVLLIGAALVGGAHAAAPVESNLSVPAAPYRAPYVPTLEKEILQQVPPASDPKVREMGRLRTQLTADPSNLEIAVALARAYMEFGRQLGDAHYAGYAEAVIAPWLAKALPPTVVLVLQATILQYRHQFADARGLLKKALQREPRNAQAWLTLATLDMVQGDYAAAAEDCGRVAGNGGVFLGGACSGNLRSYTGQAQQGMALLMRIDADATNLPAPLKAWIQGLIAEGAERLGDWPLAEASYRQALRHAPEDNFLLVAYADFLLDRNRPKEVLDLLAAFSQSDTAFLRLGLAQAALGSPEAARYTWIMAARFEALTQRGSDFYGREQVRFALHLQHDPQTALDLAQRNWQVQRAPWDARVFLEAALAAKEPQAAAPVLTFLEQTKLQDPIIEPLARALRAPLKNAPARSP